MAGSGAEKFDSGARGSGSLWDAIREVVESEGVQLFDIDLPAQGGGSLRVYITKPAAAGPKVEASQTGEGDSAEGRGGISFEECVRVSKRLLDIDENEAFIPENCLLEVSSPGINRRLRRPEHFSGAVGERVKVKFRNAETGATLVVTGIVESVDGDLVSLRSEDNKSGDYKGEIVSIRLSDVKEAKVDFVF